MRVNMSLFYVAIIPDNDKKSSLRVKNEQRYIIIVPLLRKSDSKFENSYIVSG